MLTPEQTRTAQPEPPHPARLWFVFYSTSPSSPRRCSTMPTPFHAEVAREMLLRHDWTTLYATHRYRREGPSSLLEHVREQKPSRPHLHGTLPCPHRPRPCARTQSFARRALSSTRAGLYAALSCSPASASSFFTRITIPDAMVCLWLTLALYAYWLTEQSDQPQDRVPHPSQSHREGWVFTK